jgi:hypothetical protein
MWKLVDRRCEGCLDHRDAGVGQRLVELSWQRSEKGVRLAQKLANFSLLQLYSRRSAWANLHLLGQPNTFLA